MNSAAFVTVCAISIPLWWSMMIGLPTVRHLFVNEEQWPAFSKLLAPDLGLAAMTLWLAWRLWQDRATPLVGGLVLGGWAYATALAIAWAWSSPELWLGPALMIAATVAIAVICHVRLPSRAPGARRP